MKSWCGPLCLVVLPSLVLGQSLGDAARKERERREKVQKTGASSPKITEEDLASNKGTLANDPNAQAAKAEDETSKRKKTTKAGMETIPAIVSPWTVNGIGTSAPNSQEHYWRGRAAEARARVAAAERRQFAIQRMIHIRQPAEYDENGRKVIRSIHQMKELADAADAELEVARKALEDLLDDARRAGAQPGWLR